MAKNSWIEFLKRNGGKGYTRVQLQSEYRKNHKVALKKKPSRKRTSRKKSSRKRTSRKKPSKTVSFVRRPTPISYKYYLVVGEGKDQETYHPRQSIRLDTIGVDRRIINLWRRLNKKGPYVEKKITFKGGVYRPLK